jgi:DNA polymerase bacteriophage-type
LVTMAVTYQLDLAPLADIVLPHATEQQKRKAYAAWRGAFISGDDFGLEPRVYQACDILKQAYRESNAKINQFKWDLDTAIKNAIRSPNQMTYPVGRCKVWSTGKWLIIELPSGRRLMYAAPQIEVSHEADGDPAVKKVHKRENVSYITARGKSWRRERAWSGLFVENIVQATAADVLRASLVRVHNDALTVPEIKAYLDTLPEFERTPIGLHVHDEIMVDLPVGLYPLERLVKVMTEPCRREDDTIWSEGLPIAAEGWVFKRYGKREAMKV